MKRLFLSLAALAILGFAASPGFAQSFGHLSKDQGAQLILVRNGGKHHGGGYYGRHQHYHYPHYYHGYYSPYGRYNYYKPYYHHGYDWNWKHHHNRFGGHHK